MNLAAMAGVLIGWHKLGGGDMGQRVGRNAGQQRSRTPPDVSRVAAWSVFEDHRLVERPAR